VDLELLINSKPSKVKKKGKSHARLSLITCVHLTAFLPLANGLVGQGQFYVDFVILSFYGMYRLSSGERRLKKGITRVPAGDALFVCFLGSSSSRQHNPKSQAAK
jgi:hypothetical protein